MWSEAWRVLRLHYAELALAVRTLDGPELYAASWANAAVARQAIDASAARWLSTLNLSFHIDELLLRVNENQLSGNRAEAFVWLSDNPLGSKASRLCREQRWARFCLARQRLSTVNVFATFCFE